MLLGAFFSLVADVLTFVFLPVAKFPLLIFIILPVLAMIVLSYFAFRLPFKKYSIIALVTYSILFIMPMVKTEYASNFIAMGLDQYGVGGNNLQARITIKGATKDSITGDLILLSPSTIFLSEKVKTAAANGKEKVEVNNIHIIERNDVSDLIITPKIPNPITKVQ